MIFQAYNKRINAWVKVRKFANGKTKILNVKQKLPSVPFKNIPIKKK